MRVVEEGREGKMSLEGRLEREVEIKAGADGFYRVFRKEMHLLPIVCSQHLKSVQLQLGDWETVGSVKQWNYNLGGEGEALSLKETVELVDEEQRLIVFKIVDGDPLKDQYKQLKVTIQVDPKKEGGEGCIVKLAFDYEKWNDAVAPPEAYLDMAVQVIKSTEGHLLGSVLPLLAT